MTPEKKVEEAIKAWVRAPAQGGWCVKIHAGAEQGKATLDLLGGLNGRPFLVEIKKPGEVGSPMQDALVERSKREGYISAVVDSLDEFKGLFNE